MGGWKLVGCVSVEGSRVSVCVGVEGCSVCRCRELQCV